MQDLWIAAFGTLAGFTLAGLVATGYGVLAGQRLRFALEGTGSPPELMLGMMLRLIAGPYILARKAYEMLTERDANVLAAVLLVSAGCMWGCLSGMVVLDLLGGFNGPAAAAVAR